jgi:uncharacterized membrane protein YgcG
MDIYVAMKFSEHLEMNPVTPPMREESRVAKRATLGALPAGRWSLMFADVVSQRSKRSSIALFGFEIHNRYHILVAAATGTSQKKALDRQVITMLLMMRSFVIAAVAILFCCALPSSAFLVNQRSVVAVALTNPAQQQANDGRCWTRPTSSSSSSKTQLWAGDWWDTSRARRGGAGNNGGGRWSKQQQRRQGEDDIDAEGVPRPPPPDLDRHVRDANYEYADAELQRQQQQQQQQQQSPPAPISDYANNNNNYNNFNNKDMKMAPPALHYEAPTAMNHVLAAPKNNDQLQIPSQLQGGRINGDNNNNRRAPSTRQLQGGRGGVGRTTINDANTKTYTFYYQSEPYTITLTNLDASLRHEYRATAQRQYLYDSRTPPPDNWPEEFYRMFLSHEADGPIVEQLLQELIRVTNAADHDELVQVVVAFVQGAILYNWHTYHNIEQSTTLYPYETLYDQTGVCADKSILLARLLVELGYDCVFFAFDDANHIALGVRVPRGMDDYNSGYAFVETTSYGSIGRVPTKLVGNIRLDQELPTLHRITNGGRVYERIVRDKQREAIDEARYGAEYFFLGPEQKRLKRDMVVLEEEIMYLSEAMAACQSQMTSDYNMNPVDYEECQLLVDEHNRRVELYNSMVALFNTLNDNANRGGSGGRSGSSFSSSSSSFSSSSNRKRRP